MSIPTGTQVRVYWNFHRKLFSVQTKQGKDWRVVGHFKTIRLEGVTFKVSDKGRERVLRERKKNVHAMMYGTVQCDPVIMDSKPFYISYNPYYLNRFYSHEEINDRTSNVVKSAKYALLYVIDGHPRIVGKGLA